MIRGSHTPPNSRCPQRRETSPRTFRVQFRFVLTLSAPHHPPRGLASDGEDWDHVLRLHRFRGRAHIDSRTTFFLWTDRPSPPWESARAHFVAGKGLRGRKLVELQKPAVSCLSASRPLVTEIRTIHSRLGKPSVMRD